MARRGPAPKPAESRQRRNATIEMTELDIAAGASVKIPPLPNRTKFVAATRAWYATWGNSPQASRFTSTDWQRLHMVAFLVDEFHRATSVSSRLALIAEIRQNEQKFGATPEDRERLRWRITAPPVAEGEDAPKTGAPRQRRDPRAGLRVVA